MRLSAKVLTVKSHPSFIYVDNYWEAAGMVACMASGVMPEAVRRPLAPTKVHRLEHMDLQPLR